MVKSNQRKKVMMKLFIVVLSVGMSLPLGTALFASGGTTPPGFEMNLDGLRRYSREYRENVMPNDKTSPVSIKCSNHDFYPPWEMYGWDKTVQEWGGQEEWGARTQNITECLVTSETGDLDIESRAFGAKCLVTAWFGHWTQWECPQDGIYDITFNYTHYDGLSEAIFTIHEDFSGELRTEAHLGVHYGGNSYSIPVFMRTGKHRNEKFQGESNATVHMTCYEGQTYVLGANLSLVAYTDSWDEAWSSSKIRARGQLNKISLERRNSPPDTPSRPVGVSRGTSGKPYTYAASTTDPDDDDLSYLFDWGDGTTSGWRGPYSSGSPGNASHSWHQGNFSIRVKAKDESGKESEWSDPLSVSMPCRSWMTERWWIPQIFQYVTHRYEKITGFFPHSDTLRTINFFFEHCSLCLDGVMKRKIM